VYEDLEPIANLKYGEVVESVSHDIRTRLSEAIASFSSRGLLHSGPMESEKLSIRLEGCERICRSVYQTWHDLITRRSAGHITREDIAFIMGKVESCARLRARDVRSDSQPGGIATPAWAAEQADTKMHAIASNIRRELEIKFREQEAFPQNSVLADQGPNTQPNQVRLDPLLDIPDKGAFNSDLASLSGVATAQNPLSLILADIDHFKNVNDSCGYLVGDEVLKQVAQALTTACTHKGTVYRWGGEELAVLLQNYSLAEAEVLAERLRSEVAGIQREANPRTITASFRRVHVSRGRE